MPRPPARAAFKRAFADALRDLLRRKPALTRAALARELGVSRQAIHQYLTAKSVPSQERLAHAVRTWKLTLRVGDREFDARAFGAAPASKARTTALQLDLLELLKKPADLEIPGSGVKLRVVARNSTSLEVVVNFDLTAA